MAWRGGGKPCLFFSVSLRSSPSVGRIGFILCSQCERERALCGVRLLMETWCDINWSLTPLLTNYSPPTTPKRALCGPLLHQIIFRNRQFTVPEHPPCVFAHFHEKKAPLSLRRLGLHTLTFCVRMLRADGPGVLTRLLQARLLRCYFHTFRAIDSRHSMHRPEWRKKKKSLGKGKRRFVLVAIWHLW